MDELGEGEKNGVSIPAWNGPKGDFRLSPLSAEGEAKRARNNKFAWLSPSSSAAVASKPLIAQKLFSPLPSPLDPPVRESESQLRGREVV